MAKSGLMVFCAVIVAGVLAGQAQAQSPKPWADWDYTFDREITPWSEVQAQLPAYPVEDNLIRIDVGAATQHRFFLDARSVSVGNDGVVRYTLAIKTSGGATNVSFEGIRCESREQKYYAIGRSDKSWVRARNPEWRRIEFREVAPYHLTLYADYVCRGKLIAGNAQQIVEALRRGPPQRNTVD